MSEAGDPGRVASDAAVDLADVAAAALAEIADPGSVGPLVDAVEREPGLVDLVFECLLPGYAGWRWTVSTARVEGAAPTVLEAELLPGEGALLAPAWVPWAERLAEYRRTHGDAADPGDEATDEDDDSDLDEDEDDGELDEDEDGDLDEDDDLDDDDLDDDPLDDSDPLDEEVDVEDADGGPHPAVDVHPAGGDGSPER